MEYEVISKPEGLTTPNRAVDRALSVLETVASNRIPTHLSELARVTGVPKTTVHRLLQSLVSRGFVLRAGNGYAIGPRLIRLASESTNLNGLNRRLTPLLLELYLRIDGAVCLGVLEPGNRVRYSDPLYSREHFSALRLALDRAPSHCTAAGKLLLAYNPSAVCELGASPLPRSTAHTITEVADLYRDLVAIRRRGIAYAIEEYVIGEVELAVPVFDVRGHVLAALTVVGPADRLDLTSTSVLAVQTASAASAHLRARQPRGPNTDVTRVVKALCHRRSA